MRCFKTSDLIPFKPLKTTYDGVLDMDKAIALFEEMADIPEIPFSYMRTGCDQRSVIMCDLLKAAGYDPLRVWIDNAENGRAMLYQTEDGEMAAWSFHVAPALKVEIETDDFRTLVFDPSMFDGPVDRLEWQQRVQNANRIQTLPYYREPEFTFNPSFDIGDWPDAVVNANMSLPDLLSDQKRTMGDQKRMVWESSIKKAFCEVAGRERSLSGQSWLIRASLIKKPPPAAP